MERLFLTVHVIRLVKTWPILSISVQLNVRKIVIVQKEKSWTTMENVCPNQAVHVTMQILTFTNKYVNVLHLDA